MTQTAKILNLLSLDVGDRRVGLARTNSLARLPQPLTTLIRDDSFWTNLEKTIAAENIDQLVVGLPRNLNSDDTAQTVSARDFATELQKRFGLPVALQDEALTSRKAEEELKSRGKPYDKGDIDALAATYILEDYLNMEAN